jgi:hypothetical protein
MNRPEKKHFDAAGAMSEVFATRLGGESRAVHSETAIASAARMAGTMLFRSFGLDTSKMPVGAVVLSEQANEQGPMLLNIVIMMMQQYGLQADKEQLADVGNRGEAPKLDVVQTQELFDGDLGRIRDQYGLSQEDGACACALATAWLIKECAPKIGLEVGFNIAAYGFIEGTKTVPRPEGEAGTDKPKRPWYRLWK